MRAKHSQNMKKKHPADRDAAISHDGEQAEVCIAPSRASKEPAALSALQ